MCTIEFLLLMRKNSRSFLLPRPVNMLCSLTIVSCISVHQIAVSAKVHMNEVPNVDRGDFVDVIDRRLRSRRRKIVQPR